MTAMPVDRPASASRPRRLALAGLLAVSLLGTGCNAFKKLTTTITTASKPTTTDDAPGNSAIADPHLEIQLLTVHAVAPAVLGDGTRIVGLRDDGTTGDETATSTAAATGAATHFGLLQASPSELPIKNSFIGVRGYDFKAIDQLPNRYTDEDGLTYFKYVPARIAFFLESQFQVNNKTYEMLGLTRTPEEGLNSDVTVDLASTLVARELLRIWQISGYTVSYKDLSPQDFNPLLAELRAVLRNGIPNDIPLDLTTVAPPTGKWSLDADKQDGALVFLSRLAQRQDAVNDEVNRIYQAANHSLCNCLDDSRVIIKRPDPI